MTGLYYANGSLATSSVNLLGASYTPVYGSYQGTYEGTVYNYFGLWNNCWQTTIKLFFSNNTWQTAPSGTVVGFQVANCQTQSNKYNITSWFMGYETNPPPPPPSIRHQVGPLPSVVSQGPSGIVTDKNCADVNPEWLTLSTFTVDPSDPTGDTATQTWYSSPNNNANYPWDTLADNGFPADGDKTTLMNINGVQGFIPIIWVFPQPLANGFSNGPVIFSYPLNAGGDGGGGGGRK